MSTAGPEIRPLAAPLAHRVGPQADAAQLAAAVCGVWREIGAALDPIVGPLGVAALYQRSLFLASAAHPWLTGLHEGVHGRLDLAPLQAAIAQQRAADAAAGGSALLQTFHGLLASLVGASLTERLLRPVWTDTAGGPPAQDDAR